MKPFPLLPRWSTCLAWVVAFSLTGTAARAATEDALPLPWQNQDVGEVGVEGSASFDAGAFTVLGSGVDIWGTADEFQFVYQPLTGDGTILTRVVSQHNTNEWAKAGVMIRETLDADSRFAMMTTTPEEGLAFQYRETPAAEAIHVPGALVPYPYWVLLVRSGDSFTGYVSPDGVDWTEIGTTTIPMNVDVFVGLCVTSHNDAYLEHGRLRFGRRDRRRRPRGRCPGGPRSGRDQPDPDLHAHGDQRGTGGRRRAVPDQ